MTSVVTRVEVCRTLARVRHEGRLTDAMLAAAEAEFEVLAIGIRWLPVSDEMIAQACTRPATVLKALDAIHLASAQAVRDRSVPGLVFATHDRQLARAAAALGFTVEGV